MFSINNKTFNDRRLVEYLNRYKISFSQDEFGLIDIRGQKDFKKPPIVVPEKYSFVELGNLRSCGRFEAPKAKILRLHSLEKVGSSLEVRLAKTIEANVLTEVNGIIFADSANICDINSIQKIGGSIYVPSVNSFTANSLQLIGYQFVVNSAKFLQINNLKKIGSIEVHPSMAGRQIGNLVFSELIGSRNDMAVFNLNSRKLKVGCRPWKSLAAMQKIVNDKYPSGEFREQYLNFFRQCGEMMLDKISNCLNKYDVPFGVAMQPNGAGYKPDI